MHQRGCTECQAADPTLPGHGPAGRGQGPVPGVAEPVDRAAVREPILASWWRSREWNVAADRLDLSLPGRRPTWTRRWPAPPSRCCGTCHDQLDGQPISIVLTDADRAGAAPLHRRPRPGAAARLDHAGARLLLRRGRRRHQRHRDGAGIGRSRARVRARALRGAAGGHGLRRGAAPRPGVRQDRRRDRPDLLAAGRRPADAVPGPVHRRPAQPGPRRDEQRPRPAAAAGVHPGLPAHRRHRARARQRRGHAQRPREAGPVTRRPGGADLAGHRDAARGRRRRARAVAAAAR